MGGMGAGDVRPCVGANGGDGMKGGRAGDGDPCGGTDGVGRAGGGKVGGGIDGGGGVLHQHRLWNDEPLTEQLYCVEPALTYRHVEGIAIVGKNLLGVKVVVCDAAPYWLHESPLASQIADASAGVSMSDHHSRVEYVPLQAIQTNRSTD